MTVSSDDDDKDMNVPKFGNRLKSAKLVRDWIKFGNIFLAPPVFFLTIAAIILVLGSLTVPSDEEFPPILDATVRVMGTLLSGLIGALIYDHWSKITEGGILVTRGKSAIRGLKLLLNNITSLERRSLLFLNQFNLKDKRNRNTIMMFEELIDRSGSLQEETINAIEEWQDIIPEAAGLFTQIGIISRLKLEKIALAEEIALSRDELAQTKEESEDERKRLLARIRKGERELAKVNKQIHSLQLQMDSSVLGGSTVQIGLPIITELPNLLRGGLYAGSSKVMCPHCYSFVEEDPATTTQTCSACGNSWFKAKLSGS